MGGDPLQCNKVANERHKMIFNLKRIKSLSAIPNLIAFSFLFIAIQNQNGVQLLFYLDRVKAYYFTESLSTYVKTI